MPVDLLAAVLAGVVGAQRMEAPVYLQRAAGLPVHRDVFAEGGRLLRAPSGLRRLVVGAGASSTLWGRWTGCDCGVCWAAPRTPWSAASWSVCPTMEPAATGGGSHGLSYRHYGRLDALTSWSGHLPFGALAKALHGLLAA